MEETANKNAGGRIIKQQVFSLLTRVNVKSTLSMHRHPAEKKHILCPSSPLPGPVQSSG